jgi:hypothetical protein
MRYIFSDYSLDTQRYELRRAGELHTVVPSHRSYLSLERQENPDTAPIFWRGQTDTLPIAPLDRTVGRGV